MPELSELDLSKLPDLPQQTKTKPKQSSTRRRSRHGATLGSQRQIDLTNMTNSLTMSIPENDSLDNFSMTQSLNMTKSFCNPSNNNIIGGRTLSNGQVTSSSISNIDPNSLPSFDPSTLPSLDSLGSLPNSNQVQHNEGLLVQNSGNDKKRRRRRSHAVIQSTQREF